MHIISQQKPSVALLPHAHPSDVAYLDRVRAEAIADLEHRNGGEAACLPGSAAPCSNGDVSCPCIAGSVR